ncbi:metabotropic glutamate receptor-like [Oscarella lobularis]|uniref:metabotropic glutamate receptor-like n=1 Tax=Oscarella lobularis TaxID=121494 RepID=UPI0033132D9C
MPLKLVFLVALCASLADQRHYSVPSSTIKQEGNVIFGGLFAINQCTTKNQSIVVSNYERAEAMQFAVDLINNDSSILPDIRIGYEIRDTCGNPDHGVREALKFVRRQVTDSPVIGVVGAGYSGVSMRVNDLLSLFDVPLVSYASTSPALSDDKRFPTFFRTIPPDVYQTRAIVAILKEFKWSFVHGIYSTDSYGKTGFEALRSESRREGVDFGIEKGFEVHASYETVEEALSVLDTKAGNKSEWERALFNSTVIVIFAQQFLAKTVFRVIQGTPGLRQRNFTFVGCDGWGAKEGAFIYTSSNGTLSDTFETAQGFVAVNPSSSELSRFKQHMANLSPTSASHPWLQIYWKKKLSCRGNELSCYRKTLAGQTFDSKVSYTVNAVYALSYSLHSMLLSQCDNRKTKLDCFREDFNAFKNESYRKLFSKLVADTSFVTLDLKPFRFNEHGDPAEADYDIINLKLNVDKEPLFDTVGTWQKGKLNISKPILWHDNTTNVPTSMCSLPCQRGVQREYLKASDGRTVMSCWKCNEKCPENTIIDKSQKNCIKCLPNQTSNIGGTDCRDLETTFLINTALGILILTVAAVGCILSTATVIIFLIYCRTPVVSALENEVTLTLLIGIIFLHVPTFVSISKPSPNLCGALRFMNGVFLSITMGAILVRIRCYMSAKKFSKSCVCRETAIVFMAVIVLIACFISGFSLLIAKPGTDLKLEDHKEAILTCSHYNILGSIASYVYILAIIVACIVLARKHQNNDDVKYMLWVSYAELVVMLSFTLVGFLRMQQYYEAELISLASSVTSLVAWAFLFAPKLFVVLFKPGKNTWKDVLPDEENCSVSKKVKLDIPN